MNGIRIDDDYNGYSLDHFCVPKHYEEDIKDIMIPWGLIQDRTERLARDIFLEVKDQPVIALCVLKGGYRFFTDLMEKLTSFNRTHGTVSVPIKVEFIRLQSYEDTKSSGEVKVLGISDLSYLENKHVLVIEDIIETGKTMTKLHNVLEKYNPKSIKVATLLIKRTDGKVHYQPDYCGFEIPDHFVIGYALDYNEYFRDLNHICVINDKAKDKYILQR